MMDQSDSINRTLSNARSRRRLHFWVQIMLPVLLAAGMVITLAVLASRSPNMQVSQWGAVSAVLVILPVLVSCFLGLIFMLAVNYGLIRLLKVLPPVFRQIQYQFYRVELGVRRAADKAAAPMIKSRSTAAGVRSVFRGNRNTSIND